MQLGKIVSDRYFWVLCIMGGFAILSSTMSKNPVLNPFAISIGTPADLTGIIAAASTIPGILVSLPAASLSDVFGRRKMLLFATFVFASAPFLYLFVSVWWQLALVRFYHGFATAIFVPVAEAAIAEQYPAKRGERISTFNSFTYIGRGGAPIIGGFILTITNSGSVILHNFAVLYLAVGITGVTSFVLALLLLRPTKNITVQPVKARLSMRQVLRGWLEVGRNKGAVTVSFVQAIQYYVYGVLEFYLVQYMMLVAGLNALAVSIVMSAQVVSLILSRPIMGRFSDKSSRRIPIIGGCIISGALLFVVPFTTSFFLLLSISIGYGIGFAMVISSTAPLMCELTPSNMVGTSMGFLSTMMDTGQAIGPIISGVILATTLAYSGLFSSLTLLLAISAAIFFISGIDKDSAIQNKKCDLPNA